MAANVTGRFSTFNEIGNSTQEKDANTLLTELDKGLRANKVGEQSEAIVRFPQLFEKYPFPILVNSALLKLADVFRVGNNFLKLCILRVIEQSEKHLEKILNVDEFLRRVFQVIHSNDPVARAVTLRLLGTAACIIGERKNVHHSIINSLDSHDSTERQAAIFAAAKFTEQSKTFAMSICTKLAELITGLETPVELKLKLIPIFQHMHHDGNTSVKARQLCTEMLDSYPAKNFVLITLQTLSLLAAKCLVDIPQQAELLLKYLDKDPRKAVQVRALQDLTMLAKIGPHMWTPTYIESLCQFVERTPFISLKLGGLEVLAALSSSVAADQFQTGEESIIQQILTNNCYHQNLKLSAKACEVGANLASYLLKGSSANIDLPLVDGVVLGLESLVMAATADSARLHDQQALKFGLLSIVKLCNSCTKLTDRFVDTLSSVLSDTEAGTAVLICECLSAVSSYQNDLLKSLVTDLVEIIGIYKTRTSPHRDKILVSLMTLLFQATVEEPMSDRNLTFILEMVSTMNGWATLKVTRQASRYGHHGLAAQLYNKLASQVSSEHYYFWMTALRDCSIAESYLQQPTGTLTEHSTKVGHAQTYLHKSLASLRAASTTQQPLHFQSQYIHLRARMLQVFSQLVKSCCSFQSSPPPAIAKTLAVTTGEELHACGHVVASLQKCGRQLEELGKQYGELYQSSFDADPTTLCNIQILQQCCQILIYILDAILSGKVNKPEDLQTEWASPGAVLIEHQRWHNTWHDTLSLLQQCKTNPGDPSLTYQHMACMKQAAMLLMNTSIAMPRYFFQTLQSTEIKLAISPQPKSGEPVVVHYDTNLALKVEGVLQHNRAGLFRKVDKVTVSIISEQHSRGPSTTDVKYVENPSNEMSQSASPHNDYFSVQFLLAFPVTGVYGVNIEVAVLDKQGVLWNTGPRTSMLVKSYDEAVQRQQQQQYAAHRQQMRATGQLGVVSQN